MLFGSLRGRQATYLWLVRILVRLRLTETLIDDVVWLFSADVQTRAK